MTRRTTFSRCIWIVVFGLLSSITTISYSQQTCTPDEETINVTIDAMGNLVYSQPGTIDNDTGDECCDVVNGNVDCTAISFSLPAGISSDCIYSNVSFENDQGNIYVAFVDSVNDCDDITEYGNNASVNSTSCSGGGLSIVICKPGALTVSPTVTVAFKCDLSATAPADATVCDVSEIPAAGAITNAADFMAAGGTLSISSATTECSCDLTTSDVTNWSVSDVDNTVGCMGTVERTYSFDFCGITYNRVQTFTLESPDPPILMVDGSTDDIGPTAAGCIDMFSIPASLATAVTDACTAPADITITITDDAPGVEMPIGSCDYLVTRTYRAEDDCGGVDIVLETFTYSLSSCSAMCCLLDITCPPLDGGDFQCSVLGGAGGPPAIPSAFTDAVGDDSAAFAALGGAISDMCGTIIITAVDSDNGGSGCAADPLIITRTFTIYDDADMDGPDADDDTEVCMIEYTVVDDTDPILVSCPGNLVLECDGDYMTEIAAWIMDATSGTSFSAMDNCDAALTYTSDYDGTSIPAVSCDGSAGLTVNFTATDDCMNSVSCSALIIIDDTTDPVIMGCPADLVLACDGDYAAEISAWLTAAESSIMSMSTDDCDASLSVSNNYSGAIPATECSSIAPSGLNVIFTIEDDCGNQTSCSALIAVVDETMPTVSCPASALNLEACNAANGALVLNWLNQASASDACDGVLSVTNDLDFTDLDICSGTVSVEFSATDGCGNVNTCSQNIIISDSQDPTFLWCPLDITANGIENVCDPVVNYTGPIAIDDCDIMSLVRTAGPASGSTFVVGTTTTITYLATDNCGNTAECSFNITVEDASEPTINCPLDVIVCAPAGSCTWTAAGLDPVFSEGCSGMVVLQHQITGATTAPLTTGSVNGVDFNLGTSIVSYTITNNITGETANCMFTITVEDCEAPTINCPTDALSVECGMEDLDTWIASATATDDALCNAVTVEHFLQESIDGCGLTQTYRYLFVATDAAGNSSTCIANYGTVDTTLPTINTGASDDSAECGPGAYAAFLSWLDNQGGASASDNCSDILLWSNNYNGSSFITCPVSAPISIIFTVTDECGNANTSEAEFEILDTTDPIIACPENITLECGDPNNAAIVANWLLSATATDACSNVTITTDYSSLPDCGSSADVVFTATDECGNDVTCTRSITIADTQKPFFMVAPSDLFLECDGTADPGSAVAAWLLTFGGAMAVDQCDVAPVISNTPGAISTLCGSSTVQPYTFTATDACGNLSASVIAYVHIADTTVPTLDIAADPGPISCDLADPDTWASTAANAMDVCSGLTTVSYSLEQIDDTCPGEIVYTYLFSVRDLCGNFASATGTYTVEDNTAPSISAPEDLNLACGDDFSASILSWLDDYVASDNCSNVTVTNNFTDLPSACGGAITVTFTAVDECGNSNTDDAMIVLASDAVIPVFTNCPTNITVNVDVDVCSSNVVFSTPIAEDCNEPVTVTQIANAAGDLLSSGSEFPLGDSEIVFEAEDACGNTSSCSFIITVEDSDIPSISCPSNTILMCADLGGCTWMSDESVHAIFSDNCPDSEVSYVISAPTGGSGTGNITVNTAFALGTSTVTYTITDDEGNTATCSFQVVVEDCEAPMISCTDDLFNECGSADDDEAAWVAAQVAAITAQGDVGSCSLPVVVSAELYTDVSMCGNTVERTYIFTSTDAAGNSSTCIATFSTTDTEAPEIFGPAVDPTIVECNETDQSSALLAWLNTNAGMTVSDPNACNEVTWSNNYGTVSLSDGCGNMGMVTVTFTATDACGNSSQMDASFEIQDNTAPILSCPENLILECGNENNEEIVSTWLSSATATDNCGAVTVSNDFTSLPIGCLAPGNVVTVTFTVVGNCDGMIVDCMRTITLIDTQKPVVMNAPSDLILECNDPLLVTDVTTWLTSFGGMVVVDNCDVSVDIVASAPVITELCGGSEIREYTFTATDDCGNSIDEIARIHIQDTTDPVIVPPTSVTVDCAVSDVATWASTATVSDEVDDCSGVNLSYALQNESMSCGATGWVTVYTYIFTAIDECGNDATPVTATYTVTDTEAPDFGADESNLVLSCGDDASALILAWLNGVDATDNCNGVVITNDYDGSLPDLCGDATGVSVTFTASDGCLSTDLVLMITATDETTAPVFVNCPGDLTVNTDVDLCSSNVVFSTPIAEDCNAPVTVTQIANAAGDLLTSGSEFPLGDTEIVFEAEDACGNTSSCSFVVTVVDSDDPQIFCPSTSITVCADAGTCTWASTAATDYITSFENCPDFTITHNIVSADGSVDVTGGTDVVPAGTLFPLGTNVISYMIEDANGNMVASCSFMLIVEDCEAPMISCADDLFNECGSADDDEAAWVAAQVAAITAQGDVGSCSLPVVVSAELYTDVSMCGNTVERTYIFTSTDAAGNSSTCIATFSTTDTEAPEIFGPAVDPTIVECNETDQSSALLAWLNTNAGMTVSDPNACNEVTWSNNYGTVSLSDGCGNMGMVTVTFTATDACGNSSQMDASFEIQDNTAPILSCPENLILECGNENNEEIVSTWLSSATATDNCGAVTVSNDFTSLPIGCLAPGNVVTVTFTVVGNCDGMIVDCMRTITLIDTQKPVVMNAPSDLILECNDPLLVTDVTTWLTSFGGMVVVDNCDVSVDIVASAPVITELCGGSEIREYTFTATDDCGNSIDEIARIHIQDTTDPVIVPPTSVTVDCAVSDVATWASTATVSDEVDDCSGVNLSYALQNESMSCGATGWVTVYTYIFTAIDECGNDATPVTATYTVTDTEAPDFGADESNLVLSCGDDASALILAWLNGVDATDNCNGVVITNDYDGSLPDLCGDATGVSVTFTASDGCLSTDLVLMITATDETTAPVFVNCPGDLTVNTDVDLCSSNVVFSTPIAEDCNAPVTVTQIANAAGDLLTSGSEFPLGDTEIVFEAEDACGNTSSCSFVVTVVDSDDPQIFCPSTSITVCADAGTCTWASTAATDYITSFENCPDFTITHNIVSADGSVDVTGGTDVVPAGTLFPLGTNVISYMIEDANGNMVASCSFMLIVEDCEAPTFVCAPDLTVECDGAGNATDLATFLASYSNVSDACDDAPLVSSEIWNTTSSCGGGSITTYLFTVEDEAGNATTCLADFEIEDTTTPVVTDDVPFATTVECDTQENFADFVAWLNNNAGLSTVTEVCGTFVWQNNYDENTNPIAECNGADRIFRVDVDFWVVDDCGNISNMVTKRFRIGDTTAPELTVPENITLECAEDINAAVITNWEASASAFDSCEGQVEVTFTSVSAAMCGNTEVITYTFSAEDACGNLSTENATITIQDTTEPEILCPADLVLECTGDIGDHEATILAWLATASATDNCGITMIDNNYDPTAFSDLCGATGVQAVSFMATDECDNVSICMANIIIIDTTSPLEATPAVNETVECDGGGNLTALATWLANFGGYTATDGCSTTISYSFDLLTIDDMCLDTETRTYRFIATDECGNTSFTQADFIIEDTTDPVFNFTPAPLMISCSDVNETSQVSVSAWLDSAMASDVCGNTVITHNYTETSIDVCNGGGTTTVIWTATDDCGNTSTSTSTITVTEDTAPPVITVPAPLELDCDDISSTSDPTVQILDWLGLADVTDLCDTDPVLEHDFDISLLDVCADANYSIMVTWSATDACGNAAIQQQSMINVVVDNVSPVIVVPDPITLDCSDISETSDPTVQILDWLAEATVTDACDTDPTLTHDFSITTLDFCADADYSITVTWNALDACGNAAIPVQSTINIEVDDEMPEITAPENLILDCDDISETTDPSVLIAQFLESATATDNCDSDVELTHDGSVLLDLCTASNTTITWTATDACGNTNTATAMIIVIPDTDAPVLTVPDPITLDCDDLSETSSAAAVISEFLDGASAVDNCDTDVIIEYDGAELIDLCTANVTTITWTATDHCGNSSELTSTITVVPDDEDPVITTAPLDLNIDCGDISETSQVTVEGWLNSIVAEDNCDTDLVIENNFTSTGLDICTAAGSPITVIWTVSDHCGNSATTSAVLTITPDTAPPIFDVEPVDITIDCDDVNETNAFTIEGWLNSVEVSDLCDTDVELVHDYTTTNLDICSAAGSPLEVTWTATDACGNSATRSAILTITPDETAPVLTPPADIVLDCGEISATTDPSVIIEDFLAGYEVVDECDTDPVVTHDFSETMLDVCADANYMITVTWTATDACGNSSQETADIIVDVDDTAPVISGGADMLMEECENPPGGNYPEFDYWLSNNAGATATDDCSVVSWSNDYDPENWVQMCGNAEYIDVVFTATDICGNSSSVQYRFGIGDVTPPMFINCPRPIIAVGVPDTWCEQFVNFSPPYAIDNCNGFVEITQIDGTGLGSGDLFPVGITVLTYMAEDACGNTSTCSLKIVVNDYHSAPTITECPDDLELLNSSGLCGTVVMDADSPTGTLAPTFEDNCPDNVSVIYEVVNEAKEVVACGVENVSGAYIPVGCHVVNYILQDQPLLLITEIKQKGSDQIEITNLGPASLDISCLEVVRKVNGEEIHLVPNGTVLAPGDIYLFTFTSDIDYLDPAEYCIRLKDNVIDSAVTNGALVGGDIIRSTVCDHDTEDDWVVAVECKASIGLLNPGLPVMTDNGTTTGIQTVAPSKATCSFEICVMDMEPPACAMLEEYTLTTVTPIGSAEACVEEVFTMASSGLISTISISDIVTDFTELDNVSLCLTAPNGASVNLVGDVLTGFVVAESDVKSFTSLEASGDWILGISLDCDGVGTFLEWTLNVNSFVPFIGDDIMADIDPSTAPDACGQDISFTHPYILDNCCEGTLEVSYFSDDADIIPTGGIVTPGETVEEFFGLGTTIVSYTITDGAGKTAMCSFSVIISDPDELCVTCDIGCDINCISQINFSLNENCMGELTPSMLSLEIHPLCEDEYEIVIYDVHGDPIPGGSLTVDHLGQTLTYELYHIDCMNACWGMILVEDKLPPQLDCTLTQEVFACSFTEADFGSIIPPALSVDNCGDSELVLVDQSIELNQDCDPSDLLGTLTRCYKAVDHYGNESDICCQTIEVKRLTIGNIAIPSSYSSNDCTADTSVSSLGVPFIDNDMNGVFSAGDVELFPAPSFLCNLMVSFEDIMILEDNCHKQFVRMWSFSEWWCGGVTPEVKMPQMIEVWDLNPPTISCPSNLSATTTGGLGTCEATVNLPAAIVNDDCNAPVEVDIIYPGGFIDNSNGGTAILPVGTHTITYVAYDGCYNSSQCTLEVTVEDQTQPTILCEQNTVVSLQDDGFITVDASSFDDGSYDDCLLGNFEIRRMSDPCGVSGFDFAETVTFCCADVGQEVMVAFRVYDSSGNFNECMVNVVVQDKNEASLSCPANLSIDCGDPYDLNNLSAQFGPAVIMGTCNDNLTISEVVTANVDNCGLGTILRSFTAPDGVGGTLNCEQLITINDISPFDGSNPAHLLFPLDYTTSSMCDFGDVTPDNIESISPGFGLPVINENGCDLVAVNFEDQEFTFSNDPTACFKILRTWTVIDWCQRNPDGTFMEWSHIQEIKINNNINPTIDSGLDFVLVESTDVNCADASVTLGITASDDCPSNMPLTYSYSIDLDQDGTIDHIGNTNDASGTYPIGTHSITWQVLDGCGNEVSGSHDFEVRNVKPPVAVCIQGLSVDLTLMDTDGDNVPDTNMAILNAGNFDKDSYHPCGYDVTLSFSSDPTDNTITFDCGDLGQQGVQLWVTDENGNQSFCSTFIIVEDNDGDCTVTSGLVNLRGRIFTELDENVEEVTVELLGSSEESMTEETGEYAFADMPTGGEYVIDPVKKDDVMNGISTLDLVIIQKHLLQTSSLTSPYKLIAADINRDDKLSALDLIELRKLILGIYVEFPNNDSWRFVDAMHSFVDPTDPWLTPIPEEYSIPSLNTNMDVDFVGVKIGDVNGNVQANAWDTKVDTRDANNPLVLIVPDQRLEKGEKVEVKITSANYNAIAGFQFGLEHKGLQLERIEEGVLSLNESNISKRNSRSTTFSYHAIADESTTEVLFTLIFVANKDLVLSEVLLLNDALLRAESYKTDFENNAYDVTGIQIDFESLSSTDEARFVLGQNEPNPWNAFTTFEVETTKTVQADVIIQDVLGKEVYRKVVDLQKGSNSVTLSEDEIPHKGIYNYSIMIDGQIASKKMIKI